jgi:hypothetical protein
MRVINSNTYIQKVNVYIYVYLYRFTESNILHMNVVLIKW